jgi:hypothetical protein
VTGIEDWREPFAMHHRTMTTDFFSLYDYIYGKLPYS